MHKRVPVAIAIVFVLASVFNALNAVYYYTAYAVVADLAIIAAAMLLWIYSSFSPIKSKHNKGIKASQPFSTTLIAIALAEVAVMVPDLSFQYIKMIYINSTYAAAMSIVIILVSAAAYYKIKSRKLGRIAAYGSGYFSAYISIAAMFFGILGLYSLSFYSANAYLNSQAFTGAMLFMNEGLLFMLASVSLSLS